MKIMAIIIPLKEPLVLLFHSYDKTCFLVSCVHDELPVLAAFVNNFLLLGKSENSF